MIEKFQLEQQLHEFEQDLQREKQQRTDVEGQKRKLLAELEDNKELLEERETKIRELTAHLAKREEELTRQSTKNDEDGASIALLQRQVHFYFIFKEVHEPLLSKVQFSKTNIFQIRDMQSTVDELREDLEIEKTNKNKAEVMRR